MRPYSLKTAYTAMRDLIIIFIIVLVALFGARISNRSSEDNGLETTGDYQVDDLESAPIQSGSQTSSPSGSTTTPAPTGSTVPSGQAGSVANVSVAAQAAGSEVAISSVTFTTPSWIAIHEERAGGLGNVLGAAWFPAGTHSDVAVNLLRETVAGGAYYAALYEDNGNKKYDHRVDAAVKDSLGNPIVFRFQTSTK